MGRATWAVDENGDKIWQHQGWPGWQLRSTKEGPCIEGPNGEVLSYSRGQLVITHEPRFPPGVLQHYGNLGSVGVSVPVVVMTEFMRLVTGGRCNK